MKGKKKIVRLKIHLPLRLRIFSGFALIILFMGLVIFLYGRYFIAQNIIGRTQREVARALKAAWSEYNNQLQQLGLIADFLSRFHAVRTIESIPQVTEMKKRYGFDYVYIDYLETAELPDGILTETRVLTYEELKRICPELAERAIIKDKPTPMARPTNLGELRKALVMEASTPIRDKEGKVKGRLRVGKILNYNFALVDRIQNIIFEKSTWKGKPTGTVTIFLGDRRIATTVRTEDEQRAVGTLLSCTVSDKVYGQGVSWNDRAFVVNDWYLTAYDPIRTRDGRIVGILYVGILEAPFLQIRAGMYLNLGLLLFAVILACLVLSYRIASGITTPVRQVTAAAQSLAKGNWDIPVETSTTVDELNIMLNTFNMMAKELQKEREELLHLNQKLHTANKNYLNMIGFVSHELKGVLGSIIMNIYALKDGYLGPLNEAQKKALDAAAKSLDHFEMMVKNYLDLSRIEKGELKLAVQQLDLLEDVVKPCLITFEKPLQEKKMKLQQQIPPGIILKGDRSLLQIVFNNLISNAIKYGKEEGVVQLSCSTDQSFIHCQVYNDGQPLTPEQQSLLFKRFSRLPETTRVKGTGLGLFITKEIIEKHGGRIWVQPAECGNAFCFTLNKGEIDGNESSGGTEESKAKSYS